MFLLPSRKIHFFLYLWSPDTHTSICTRSSFICAKKYANLYTLGPNMEASNMDFTDCSRHNLDSLHKFIFSIRCEDRILINWSISFYFFLAAFSVICWPMFNIRYWLYIILAKYHSQIKYTSGTVIIDDVQDDNWFLIL